MVLERQIFLDTLSIFCTATRFTLPNSTYESKSLALIGEVNLGCLSINFLSKVDRTNIDRIDLSLTVGQSCSRSN